MKFQVLIDIHMFFSGAHGRLGIPCLNVGARKFFQEAFRDKYHWDDKLPKEFVAKWNVWLNDIKHLSSYEVSMHIRLNENVPFYELHFFFVMVARLFMPQFPM